MQRNIITLCGIVAFLALSTRPAASVTGREATVSTSPGGNTVLPYGFVITPTASPGAIFQPLTTGLRPDGSADANGAVTTALSPDGTALLILTTGYNKNFFGSRPSIVSSNTTLAASAENGTLACAAIIEAQRTPR